MLTGGKRASTVHPCAHAVFWAQHSRQCHQSLCSNNVVCSTAHNPSLKELPLYGRSYTIPPCAYTEYSTIDFSQASLHPTLDSNWMLIEWLNTVPLSIQHCITTACGSGGTAPQFLTSAVQEGFTQPVTLTLVKKILISTRQGGPQSWSRSSGELKNLLPLLGIELQLLSHPACRHHCTDVQFWILDAQWICLKLLQT